MTTEKTGSLSEKLMKAGKRTAGTKATVMAVSAQESAALRGEGDIRGNPIYILLNSADTMEHAEIVDQLGKVLARDPSLSKEENQARLRQFEELNRYYQDQMIGLAQKLTDFSHDEALSLYDDTVEGIKKRLISFKTDIEPLVKALQVIRTAEESGQDPHKMIEAVQELHKKRAELEEELRQLAEKKELNDGDISSLTSRADQMRETIETLGRKKEDAALRITNNDTAIAEKKKKLFGSFRFKDEISELEGSTYDLRDRIADYERDMSDNTAYLSSTSETLKKKEQIRDDMAARHTAATAEIESVRASLQGDENTQALSRLLEITGSEYKGKRDDLVGNAQKFIEDAIGQFNSSIGRFVGLEGEIANFSRTAKNVVEMQFLLIAGGEKAYQIMDEHLKMTETEEARLAEEEKGLDFHSSAREKAIVEVRDGKEYMNAFLPTRDSVVGFRKILAEREAEFTALSGLVQGKRLDAEELRTNGAVAVASQLVMTLKSLEAAVAGQKTDMLRSMLHEFTNSARQATTQVLDGLVDDQKGRNVRLDEAITSLVEMRAKIDDFSDNLLAERVTGAGLTEAIINATDRVVQSTEELANTVADGRRDAKDQVGKDAAAEIVDSYENQLGVAAPQRKLG
jgi:hypothetical protein